MSTVQSEECSSDQEDYDMSDMEHIPTPEGKECLDHNDQTIDIGDMVKLTYMNHEFQVHSKRYVGFSVDRDAKLLNGELELGFMIGDENGEEICAVDCVKVVAVEHVCK